MVRSSASLLCLALLPICQGIQLAEKQFPYSQSPYGQPAYPPAPYGQPVQGQFPYGASPYGASPYGAPAYPQSAYGQPVASPYASPYAPPQSPPTASQPQASALQPQVQPAAPVTAVPAAAQSSQEVKRDPTPVRTYFEGLLGSSPEERANQKAATQKLMQQAQADFAKKFLKGSINFVKNTIQWVNETKQPNGANKTVERLVGAVKGVTPETAKTIEHLAIPLIGSTVLQTMPLTNRERVLANFGLGAAMMKVMQTEDGSQPLLGEAKTEEAHTEQNVTADLTAVDARKQPPLERMIMHWLARGE
mmetsp:Transcript_86829/g.230712  ORF Transcript_86829/g.230712 Transcript_86829/m.230712 type:complete len:306 (-) Transcript_86829:128-1045(-)